MYFGEILRKLRERDLILDIFHLFGFDKEERLTLCNEIIVVERKGYIR